MLLARRRVTKGTTLSAALFTLPTCAIARPRLAHGGRTLVVACNAQSRRCKRTRPSRERGSYTSGTSAVRAWRNLVASSNLCGTRWKRCAWSRRSCTRRPTPRTTRERARRQRRSNSNSSRARRRRPSSRGYGVFSLGSCVSLRIRPQGMAGYMTSFRLSARRCSRCTSFTFLYVCTANNGSIPYRDSYLYLPATRLLIYRLGIIEYTHPPPARYWNRYSSSRLSESPLAKRMHNTRYEVA